MKKVRSMLMYVFLAFPSGAKLKLISRVTVAPTIAHFASLPVPQSHLRRRLQPPPGPAPKVFLPFPYLAKPPYILKAIQTDILPQLKRHNPSYCSILHGPGASAVSFVHVSPHPSASGPQERPAPVFNVTPSVPDAP